MPRTKVTILSGFLGAGKTTLLNALLRGAVTPLGVIVNDFGAVNIDAELVAGDQAALSGEVALENGCICCTIRGDLLDALRSLLDRPNPPRHVVIEASGVSDPAAIAGTFLHPRLQDRFELSTIVVCVDPSELIGLTGQDWDIASAQVAVADFVVLTKADLASTGERVATREVLRSIAPDVRVVESTPHSIPGELILAPPTLWAANRRKPAPPPSVHVHEVGETGPHHHEPGHGYETWTYRSDEPLSVYGLRRVLKKLPSAVFRVKGLVRVAEDTDARVAVHVVGRRAELAKLPPCNDAEATESVLVFLGPTGSLDPADLTERMKGCRPSNNDPTAGFMDDMLGYFNRLLSGMPAQ